MVWGCFSHDHKLDLMVVRQNLTGQSHNDDILQPIVYPHLQAHQAAHPIFQDDNACPYRACVVIDSLAQKGIEKLQWPSRSPVMSPIEHCWDRVECIVSKRNEPRHEISNNGVYVTSKASNQPAHTRNLISAFASHLNIL